ncbi:Hypothetical predicted protein [Octopus vulgaris]|uniref:Uncharacterized protein n=1 Tax=Octopus vulgaris TaxID=6645 RepID=A0AA36AN07_OCTVU|nr:Hypothetical predicted protein [Octopus vulgaris]
MLGCLMDGSVEDIAECSGGEIGDFEYDAGIGLGVVVAEDGCGGGIGGCSNGCGGGCEDDSDIDSLCIELNYICSAELKDKWVTCDKFEFS